MAFLAGPAAFGRDLADLKKAGRLRVLNDYLANVRRSGTWNRLAVKYFGAAAPEILKRAK